MLRQSPLQVEAQICRQLIARYERWKKRGEKGLMQRWQDHYERCKRIVAQAGDRPIEAPTIASFLRPAYQIVVEANKLGVQNFPDLLQNWADKTIKAQAPAEGWDKVLAALEKAKGQVDPRTYGSWRKMLKALNPE